jgi:hypothetical protein
VGQLVHAAHQQVVEDRRPVVDPPLDRQHPPGIHQKLGHARLAVTNLPPRGPWPGAVGAVWIDAPRSDDDRRESIEPSNRAVDAVEDSSAARQP